MNRIIVIAFILGLFFNSTMCTSAQGIQKEEYKKFYLELRPIQFILNGYSVVGHYAINNRMQLGFNVFAATLSDGITDFVWNTEGNIDLEAEQDIVLALSYRYFLDKNKLHHGFFTGAALGIENYSLTDKNINEERDYQFWYVAPRIGYLWHPFNKSDSGISGVFLDVELVTVFPVIQDDEVSFSSGGTADINSVLPSPLVGIGFRF